MTKPDCENCKYNASGICVEPKTLKYVPENVPTKMVAYCSQMEAGQMSILGLLSGLVTQ